MPEHAAAIASQRIRGLPLSKKYKHYEENILFIFIKYFVGFR